MNKIATKILVIFTLTVSNTCWSCLLTNNHTHAFSTVGENNQPTNQSPFLSNECLSFTLHFCRYNAANFVVTYCVPLGIMAVCYTIISTKLWGNGLLGENIPNRARQITAKRKVSGGHSAQLQYKRSWVKFYLYINY